VLVKPVNGGGGIGMQPACHEAEHKRTRSLATRSFGDAEFYLGRLLEKPLP